jgi:hypothetical protein
MTFSHGAGIVTDGLAMLMDAANPRSYPKTGTVWSDISGNRITGTITNGSVYNTSYQGYFPFSSASNQYVNIGTSTILQSLTSAITISAWCLFTSFPPAGTGIYTIYDSALVSATSTEQTFLRLENDVGQALLSVGTFTGSANVYATYSYTNLSINRWYHIVGGYTGTAWVLYVNGVLVKSTVGAGPTAVASSLFTIGASTFMGSVARYFDGNISSIQIYNRALSIDEIAQNFQAYRGRYGM